MIPSKYLRWFLPLSITILWLLAPFVLSEVVTRNAQAGVYGIADVVSIPIVSASMLCLVGCPYFAFFAIAGFQRYSANLPPWYFQSTVRQWVVLLLFLIGAVVLISEILYWWSTAHIPIIVVYSLTLAWLIWVRPIAAVELSLPPNKPLSNPLGSAYIEHRPE